MVSSNIPRSALSNSYVRDDVSYKRLQLCLTPGRVLPPRVLEYVTSIASACNDKQNVHYKKTQMLFDKSREADRLSLLNGQPPVSS